MRSLRTTLATVLAILPGAGAISIAITGTQEIGTRFYRVDASGATLAQTDSPFALAKDLEQRVSFVVKESEVQLPTGEGATPSLELEQKDIEREARALVLEPEGGATSAVVFLHGFSQQPKNYISTLRAMAASGTKVVAPTTGLLDVVLPWVKVETATNPFDFPGKLQTAITIDGLRSIKMLQDQGFTDIALCGHSMGGACSLVIPSILDKTTELTAIFAMSPASNLQRTELNPYLRTGGGLSGDLDVDSAVELFEKYDTKPKVTLMSAANDRIVRAKQVEQLYGALRASEKMRDSGTLLALKSGSHIGFEDSLDVRLPDYDILPVKKIKLFFNFIDLLIYRFDVFDFVLGNLDLQLQTAKICIYKLLAGFNGAEDLSAAVKLDDTVDNWGDVLSVDAASDELKQTFAFPLQATQ